MIPSIETNNKNQTAVCFGCTTIYYSYSTPIAVYHAGEFFIRVNDWGSTTGRHLNAIDSDHSKRISGIEFAKKLEQICKGLKL